MKHKSLEMKYLVSCGVTLNLLFLANIISSEVLVDSTSYEYNYADLKEQKIQFYDIKSSMHLSCNLTGADSTGKIVWKKEDKLIGDIPHLHSRSKFNKKATRYDLVVEKAEVSDAGNYSCVYMVDNAEQSSIEFIVSSKPAVRVQSNTNVVEGEKLHIPCTVLGNPPPIVYWKVGNETYEESRDRIKILSDTELGINNTILVIEDVVLDDRKLYTCYAKSIYSDKVVKETSTQVRVKDKLAALWPFLGICAEVFVLCAIILIYEKKRNKTEMEESDTDQSPDQKNTPDHGKDSDVRLRK